MGRTVESAPPLRVVINADDLGLHPAVRRAVERLAEVGAVTSASVLANGPDLTGAARLRGLSLGAHLNILRGRPLSPPREVRSLVGGDGLFLGSWRKLATRAFRGGLVAAEVEREWGRQVATLQDRGIRLTHADAEKHTHCLPGLFEVAKRVALAAGIPFLRRPYEPSGGSPDLLGRLRVGLLRRLVGRSRIEPPLRAADAVWGIAHPGGHLRPEAFARAYRAFPPGGIVEIVCHPGRPSPGDGEIDPAFGKMGVRVRWEPEADSLERLPWRETFDRLPARLVGFGDLVRETDPAT